MYIKRTLTDAVNHEGDAVEIEIRWPWWIHPAWALLFLTGGMALVAICIPADTYFAAWGVPKFLDSDASGLLLICILAVTFGIVLTSGLSTHGGSRMLSISGRQVTYLRRAYKVLFALTVTGYLLFFVFGYVKGVGLNDLIAVLQRDPLATYRVKAQVQTIPGLTTMTQFGPIAVAIGFLLKRIGHGSSSFLILLFLSCLRVVFYSERLALIEMLVPLILVAALTRRPGKAKWIGLAPAVIAPFVWGVFSASEYIRSWVYYQNLTTMPFTEWVTLRLIGYYTTSFNNSALFMQAHEGTRALPFFSVGVFWNAPGLSSAFPYPGVSGTNPDRWWSSVLSAYGRPEFNNQGSFLVAWAEFGPFLALLFWFAVGTVLGALFSAMTRGSLPGLLAYSVLFIGILELARIGYWMEGRAAPALVGLIAIACTFPRASAAGQQAQLPEWAAELKRQQAAKNENPGSSWAGKM